MLTRRGLIGGLIAVAAPAIVPVSALMPLRGKRLILPPDHRVTSLGGSLSAAQRDKIYKLLIGLKRDGLWDKLDTIWLFAPDEPIKIQKVVI